MVIRIFGLALMLIGNTAGVKAAEYTEERTESFRRLGFFHFPKEVEVLKFLDSQFDGNLFPGKFDYQDENFKKLLKSCADRWVNQEDIANFIKGLEPYYRKNFEARLDEIPTRIPRGMDYAIARKQDQLLKYFYDRLKLSTPEKEVYKYFVRVAELVHLQPLDHLKKMAEEKKAKL